MDRLPQAGDNQAGRDSYTTSKRLIGACQLNPGALCKEGGKRDGEKIEFLRYVYSNHSTA